MEQNTNSNDRASDTKEKSNKKKKGLSKAKAHKLKLVFNQVCPSVEDVRKLHPAIKNVFRPKRPASIRYCIIKLSSANLCKEVSKALHGRHIEPFEGRLKCKLSTEKILREALGEKLNVMGRLTRPEVEYIKQCRSSSNLPINVLKNSAAWELSVRYGVHV